MRRTIAMMLFAMFGMMGAGCEVHHDHYDADRHVSESKTTVRQETPAGDRTIERKVETRSY